MKQTSVHYPIVAIIGRPNVGKSTLFNRLIGRRQAITSHIAGTTRDRHFGVMHWYGHTWSIIDTAGILSEDTALNEEGNAAITEQINLAFSEADYIFFVVDTKSGIQSEDRTIMQRIHRERKPYAILVNKADNQNLRYEADQFAGLGATDIFPVSSLHGTGVGDVMSHLITQLPSPIMPEARPAGVTIIGRPNVGKSQFINRLVGYQRTVVSSVPGTTRDAITTLVSLPDGTHFELIDTAGIRRSGKIELGIERHSLFRTIKAINRADIVILVLTIEENPTRGDAHVAAYALEAKKELIIVLNKIDLAKEKINQQSEIKQKKLAKQFLRRFAFLAERPTFFVSALTGEGIAPFTHHLAQYIKNINNSDEELSENQKMAKQ